MHTGYCMQCSALVSTTDWPYEKRVGSPEPSKGALFIYGWEGGEWRGAKSVGQTKAPPSRIHGEQIALPLP